MHYLEKGNYEVRIDRAFLTYNRLRQPRAFVECTVLDSDNYSLPVGSQAAWVVALDTDSGPIQMRNFIQRMLVSSDPCIDLNLWMPLSDIALKVFPEKNSGETSLLAGFVANVTATERLSRSGGTFTRLEWERSDRDCFRRNPYPEFGDCSEAMVCLLDEIINVDFEKASTEFGKRLVDKLQIHVHISKIPEFIFDFSKIRSLEDIERFHDRLDTYERGWDVLNILSSSPGLPPAYLMTEIEAVENVEFIHTFPQPRYASIEEHGIYGRMDPSRIALTRDLNDVYIKGNGYIFGYEPAQFMKWQGTIVDFSTYLKGKAREALSFTFRPDEEKQMIIPVKCIEYYTLSKDVDWRELDEEELIAEDLLADPLKFQLHTPHPCDKCGTQTILNEHSFVGNSILCDGCRTEKER